MEIADSQVRFENSLFHLVKMSFYLFIYSVAGIFLNPLDPQGQLLLTANLVFAAIALFVVEVFLENIGGQDFIGILIYLVIILGFSAATIYLIFSAANLLMNGLVELNQILTNIAQIYFVIYWVYLGVKRFCIEMWDFDIV